MKSTPVLESDMKISSSNTMPSATVSWRDYLALTKPRVISLLLFTTLASLFIAAHSFKGVSLLLFLMVAIGGYMAAGAANTFNMVVDQDIDLRMARTAGRPIVTSAISSKNAMLFAFVLTTLSFVLLYFSGGLLCAMLAMAGLLFYVVIYTLLLKRRTWQNIVIGGAAGCFPSLVGWAAVQHSLNVFAWLLFAIVFFWTPVHFWALALLIKDDYAAANIPMLPVVHGDQSTIRQIIAYMFVTVGVTYITAWYNFTGLFYLLSATVLNIILGVYTFQLWRSPQRKSASRLFHYSMLYLALLFLCMAIDRCLHF